MGKILKIPIVVLVSILFASTSYGGEAGLINEKRRWKAKLGADQVIINACWESVGDSAQIDYYLADYYSGKKATLGIYEVGYLKKAVREAVEKTWIRYGGVEIFFKEGLIGNCDVIIRILEIGRSNSNVGQGGPSKPEVHLNLVHARYYNQETEGLTSSQIARANESWIRWRESTDTASLKDVLRRLARRTAVHEFGHLLGFYHEHARYREASAFGEAIVDRDSTKNPNAIAVGYYDRYSIMNYNNASTASIDADNRLILRDRDGTELGLWPKLSCGDVIAIRRLYPPSPIKSQLAPCCTEVGYNAVIANLRENNGPPYPTYADYYHRNRACFQEGEIESGSGSVLSCVNLAKIAAGGEVCSTGVDANTIGGDLKFSGSNYNEYINGDRPTFRANISVKYATKIPNIVVRLTVPNLEGVHERRVRIDFAPELLTSSGRWVKADLAIKTRGALDLNSGFNELTWEFPLGHGPYDETNNCFCEVTSIPSEGTFAEYIPQTDLYRIDNSYTALRFNYRVREGVVTKVYRNTSKTELHPSIPFTYHDLVESENFLSLDVGDLFRINRKFTKSKNRAPSEPIISEIAGSDNGQGVLKVSWLPSVDPDSDTLFYFVEVRHEKQLDFKSYPVSGPPTLTVSGLIRGSKYFVRVKVSDSKDRVIGEAKEVQLPSLPDVCTEANSEKIVDRASWPWLFKSEIATVQYKTIPAGTPDTYVWEYPASFCVEHNPGKFGFLDISVSPEIGKTDWLFLETDKSMLLRLYFQEGNGPQYSITPGSDINNPQTQDWSGNLIRLSDYWGEDARYFSLTNWKSSQALKRISITYKISPQSRTRSRFGKIKVFKSNPYGIGFLAQKINGSLTLNDDISYTAYVGEDVKYEAQLMENNLVVSGSLFSTFEKVNGSFKNFQMNHPQPIGDRNSHIIYRSMNYPYEEKRLNVNLSIIPAPILSRIVNPSGSTAKFLVPGKLYQVDMSGLEKPMSTLELELNDQSVPVIRLDGGQYGFICPRGLIPKNRIQVIVNGVRTNSLTIRKRSISMIISLLM